MTHTPCRDCEIKYDAHAGESITFCPLHEAAGELLGAAKMAKGFVEIAKDFARHFETEAAMSDRSSPRAHIGWQGLVSKCRSILDESERSYVKTLTEVLDAAITKAEGE